ncbi:two component transcriptional regulator, LytTR family [Clostridium cavendishii DSM 21758]|uniref:Stage 0 sporulation protein A homolog n=1 Tax=Clostridium cavendishii DSM 21758 TaxID=1121302 RepID=A0A1M6U9S5_9CLOT|nr:LytTR family DNA-binding domain-containing protein [Clostridium cavendishii]SHK65910.1 two component transcriptional regulator, LytTR family [Clostridium cavendishii DSM 21758]
MLDIIIIDDEKIAVEELEYVFLKSNRVNIVGKYSNAKEGIEGIKAYKPHAVFLDIDMPGINGLLSASEIKKVSEGTQIVFVTAHDKYAIKAFEVNALDYILKPFSEERINKTLDRILSNESYQELQVENTNKHVKKIPVKTTESLLLINIDEIVFCHVKDGAVFIHTEKEIYESEETLIQLEKRLEDFSFIKCHRNYIVNIELIISITPWINGTYLLKVKGTDEEIPVSRNYNKVIKKTFKI